jgi:hypothetical protein
MKIPLQPLLEQLGIRDIELDTPEAIEAFKKQLDQLLAEYDKPTDDVIQ